MKREIDETIKVNVNLNWIFEIKEEFPMKNCGTGLLHYASLKYL